MDSNEHAGCPAERPSVTLDAMAVLANCSLFRLIREGSVGREVIETPARIAGFGGIEEIMALVDSREVGRLAA